MLQKIQEKIQDKLLYSFTKFDTNEYRGIYELDLDDCKLIAKISIINNDDQFLNVKGKVEPYVMERLVYQKLSIENKCPYIPECKEIIPYTKGSRHIITSNNSDYVLDFTDWSTKLEPHVGYCIIIMKKYSDYQLLGETDYSKEQIERIFIKIMKIMIELNHNYNFTHCDLKNNNILINNQGDIKIFDFDISSLCDTCSIRQEDFTNYELTYGINSKHGLIFDFFRLYTSFYLWDNLNILDNNEYTKHIQKIMTRVRKIYRHILGKPNYNNIFNNVDYFCEWFVESGVTYNDVVSIVNNYNPK